MKQAAIIICNYNKSESVRECITCVLEQKFDDFDIYVVDNASTDDSVSMIRDTFADRVTLLVNKENLGGSGGFNTGLRAAYEKGYPYLMCVDNDCMLDENVVANLIHFLEDHEDFGMAAAKIDHLEDPDHIQQFGQSIDFTYFCTEVPYLNMPDDGTLPEYLSVDSAAACALMVRRTTIEKIGFLPEENFLYWDDTEWCYRCNLAGMKVAAVSSATALHAMGAKKENVTTFPTYYAWRNWIRFFCKYTPPEQWDRLCETFLESIFAVVYEGIHKGEYNRLKTVMLAYDDAICGVTGKAGEHRIFDIDNNDEPFRKLFASADCFYIEENGFPTLAGRLKKRAESLGFQIHWLGRARTGVKTITLCESIFSLDDLSLKNIYLDIDDCLLATEDDALDVINYNYSKRCFVLSHKTVFLEKIPELCCCLKDSGQH